MNFSNLIAKQHVDGYPQWDTIIEFDYFISLLRSVGCFLLGLLCRIFFLFNLYFTICTAGHLVNFSNLIAK